MNISEFKYKSNYYALTLLIFVIPLERKLIAPFTILFVITSLFNGSLNYLKANFKALFFSFIYILYCIGVIYSDNSQVAKNDLMTKLPLLIIPLGFAISKIKWKKDFNKIFKSFIDGCFASTLIALTYSFVQFYFNNKGSSFFYGNISLFAHPSYLAMLLNLAIIYIYYHFIKTNSFNIKKLVLIAFFSIYILLLASKTGLITMVITHLIFIIVFAINKKKFLSSGILILCMTLLISLAYMNSNTFKNRIDDLFTLSTTEKNQESSTAARSTIWLICIDKIIEQPILGYGTGNEKNVLSEEYKKRELNYFLEKELNAHNQFLQTTLALGLIGGLCLFLMIIIPVFYSIKNKHTFYLSFLLLITINFLTESMLERQVGIIFYSVFNSLFFVYYFNNKTRIDN